MDLVISGLQPGALTTGKISLEGELDFGLGDF